MASHKPHVKITPMLKARLRLGFMAGKTLDDLSAEYGIGRRKLSELSRTEGWADARSKVLPARDTRPRAIATEAERCMEAVADQWRAGVEDSARRATGLLGTTLEAIEERQAEIRRLPPLDLVQVAEKLAKVAAQLAVLGGRNGSGGHALMLTIDLGDGPKDHGDDEGDPDDEPDWSAVETVRTPAKPDPDA